MQKQLILLLISMLILGSCAEKAANDSYSLTEGEEIITTKVELKDKIRGGWAGQVIGCTYGGPTEFKFKGSMIPDDHFIPWNEDVFAWWYEHAPGLYDDVYMDLTFVNVFQRLGLDAPVDSFAMAFATADYQLWHANQAARYNILNGIMPPGSGFWKNNPHADDIDFQIEADFAGIMAPGMTNTATLICDSIGHIMNYGDGWYGGVYVAAMYSLAYVSDDIKFVVNEGLKTIPAESEFYQLISDVIGWYSDYPDDWKMTWFNVQKKWASEVGCPDGVYKDFNIDAKINAAYIIIGLLYGDGDFGRTVEISTRCGQDSDCNPASAAGILGTILGYEKIPANWKDGLDKVENINFRYTDISLNKAYNYSLDQAIELIQQNGGKLNGDKVQILYQQPKPVKFEKCFEGHFPAEFMDINRNLNQDKSALNFEFMGNGFVLSGGWPWGTPGGITGELEVTIDGEIYETALLPSNFSTRRHELSWAYGLDQGKHTVQILIKNPPDGQSLRADRILVYSNQKELRSKHSIKLL